MESVLVVSDPTRSSNARKDAPAAPHYVRKPGPNAPIKLPGYGLLATDMTINRSLDAPEIRHPISNGVSVEAVTVREIRMLEFMNQITDKPDWEKKVFDEVILAKWKEEGSKEIEVLGANDVALSDEMFEYCIKELQEKAREYSTSRLVVVLNVDDRVVKSDLAVSEDLRLSLVETAKALEDVPERFKDWHPGSDGLVLDLVHPSMFPLIYGVSWVLPNELTSLDHPADWSANSDIVPPAPWTPEKSGEAEDLAFPLQQRNWGNYMWLPSNVSFDKDGRSHIDSYINNLHPVHHKDLYPVLEKILDATIPLWNEVLTECPRRRIVVSFTGESDFLHPEGVKYPGRLPPGEVGETSEDEDDRNSNINEDVGFQDGENNGAENGNNQEEFDEESLDEEDEWELEDRYRRWRVEQAVLDWPEPRGFVPTAELNTKAMNLRGLKDGIQVIFKLANIHLTPEKPQYPGGSWHIEGALNEHICASAIFYYDEENITASALAFRNVVDEEEILMLPAQNEYESAEYFFGVEQDGENIQDLGRVSTHQGRLLCFPNILQHQVQPFELKDHSKPGHRKILAMFLVDPHISVLSTANIPSQSKIWWSEEVRKIGLFSKLPQELFDSIMEYVEYPMSWEDALKIRELLMAERTAIVDEHLSEVLNTISFCEH